MADSTISGLTAATALQAADLAAVVQGGTTKKATLAQIQANSLPLAGGTMTGNLNVGPAQITSAAGQGDFFGGASAYSLLVGSDTSSSALRTDATNKVGRIVTPHYTNAEQAATMMVLTCTSTASLLQFGGGTSLANATTSLNFFAAANTTTVTGTEMMRLTTAGVRIQSGVSGDASSLFHVAATGDANALRVDDTTGTASFGMAPTSSGQVAISSDSSVSPGIAVFDDRAFATGVGGVVSLLGKYNAAGSSIGFGTITGGKESATDGNTGGYVALTTKRNGSSTFDVLRATSLANVLIGTATDVATSLLTLASTTQGFLPPRMTTTQRDAISTPATGLIAYNTTTNKINVYTGSAWEAVTSA